MLLRKFLLLLTIAALASAQYNRQRANYAVRYNASRQHPCDTRSCYPATGNLLIGREAQLHASSTCGLDEVERYCIVSHLEERGKCFRCDSSNATINNPDINHRVQNIIYRYYPGSRHKSWWQSQNGVENVNIRLDLEAEFHFTHLIIVFKTFRPAAMLVERSYDFGKTWRVYRYFAYNCDESFPGVPKHSSRILTDVVCESRYSSVAPSTDGEVIYKVLPPNIVVDNPYSSEVQNLLKMTNLRINFTRLHTLGDDLLENSNAIREKYYYAISEMTVRGSCSCYGHASRCLPRPGVEAKTDMVHGRCECNHNTKGLNCELCEDFFNDIPWQPAVGKTTNKCKRCTCNNHATSCHFDAAVFELTGKVSGGVCDECQHNTMGRNCETCKEYFYQDPTVDIQSPDICKPCDCDQRGSLDGGICDPITDASAGEEAGKCHCKANIEGRRCDSCKEGYWNFDENNPDGCQACTCNALGTVGSQGCDVLTGECTCKRYVTGHDCNQCLPEFYGLSENNEGCSPCDCDIGGSLDNNCDVVTGQCRCRSNVQGRSCDQPSQHYFSPSLNFLVHEAEISQCEPDLDANAINNNCQVVFREPFRDGREDTWTGTGFMKVSEDDTLKFTIDNLNTSIYYDIYIRYEPQVSGDWEQVTVHVDRPSPIRLDSPCANSNLYHDMQKVVLSENSRTALVPSPVCLEANNQYDIRITFESQKPETSNARANILIDSIVLIPNYKKIPIFSNSPSAELNRRKFDEYNCGNPDYFSLQNVNIPEECKKYHISIGLYVFNGALSCSCDATGSLSHACIEEGGQCPCKTNVVGRKCDRCAPGTYGFGPEGCKSCDCNNIGALHNFCDLSTGQCRCRSNTYGRQCDECQPGYWNFPTCQQCECNGHADVCEPHDGACTSCRDSTDGHRCERCLEGYYGDPQLGINIACRACPCPGTRDSGHSYAAQCYLDESTKDVVCECQEGYAGARCDVCAENYFGHPEEIGGSCQACDCSQNVDPTKLGNCDLHTGQCKQCLYDTEGDHCEICKAGYFGDALTQTCVECVCNLLGTDSHKGMCNRTTGQCPCFKNVLGLGCGQCLKNHWRLASGEGCDPCDCDSVGSISEQCNEYDGMCECKEGFGGRQCNQCQTNYWGDPNVKCYPCKCDRYGSITQQCERDTGICICEKGIGGDQCNKCARGYLDVSTVESDRKQCSACGECFDNWDRIIFDLQKHTQQLIANASEIRTVGATGAYTRDFDEMDNKVRNIQNLLNDTLISDAAIKDLAEKVQHIRDQLLASDEEVSSVNSLLADVTTKINLGKVTLHGLSNTTKTLNDRADQLNYDATKIQEANLEGALNLTREAKDQAMKATDDADQCQKILAETERQIKGTEQLVSRQYDSFNNTHKKNEETLLDLLEKINNLKSEIPDLNEEMCGQAGDSCDICGGASCGKCGGISCEKGAVTKADQALDFAKKTEQRINEHQQGADELLRGISQAKQDTQNAFDISQHTFDTAVTFKNETDNLIKDSVDSIASLQAFLSNASTSPADVRALANEILARTIELQPEEITQLSQEINSTVSQLTNIESIIAETRNDLDRAKNIELLATKAKSEANKTLDAATKVLQALDEAALAQASAEKAISQANSDIEAARADLAPIASETDRAQIKANDTMEEVGELQIRLGNLQKNILKTEIDAQQVKEEANVVVLDAEQAQQQARELRQKYQTANNSLTQRAEQSASSRERAQSLLDRATQLSGETQSQLNELQKMEDLYIRHTELLGDLEQGIDDLNAKMALYLAEITERWLYLEPILSGGSELGEKFARVDRDFRQVMRSTSADVRLAALLQSPRLPSLLDSILQQLASCQAALDEYISDKRRAFPRFYFLSDDDLLELLGQARAGSEGREDVLQTHLKKLFPGATGVQLDSDVTSIAGLCSHHGEVLVLDSPVHIDVAVEVWLQSLEQQMRKSLRSSIQRCLDPKIFDIQDPFSFPTQVLCLAQNIRFSQQAEKSMQSKDLLGLKDNISKERNSYINADGSEEENEGEKNKRQALVLQCTHYLHILDELVDNHVVSPSHWLWQKQLRFYVLANNEVIAKMGLAKLSYSYEYLGTNTGQLVRTELTDQCFLILTQALHLGLAGNPFGPAGTGKTESVKALGGLLGRLVLVFNCDEAMDAYSVSRLLTGLALSGSWGCFDEFNRLTAETLASVSRPLTALLRALAAKGDTRKTTAILNQQEVSVSTWCGIFCTMNPAGGSYGGRRQLPSALSSVLRPVAMWTPRRERIAAALLAAKGATSPDQAATKLTLTFRLARDLLRPLHHYDWGLRALKSVIGTCGAGLGLARYSNDGRGPDLREQMDIIVKAIRLNTVSKLSYQDINRFNAILSTVFPGVSHEDIIPQELKKAIERSYVDLNLKYNTEQVRKCVELHEQLQQRMGVAIVGSPGSGKTTVRHLLKHALIQSGRTIKEHTICAKAISHSQLLGYIDPDTRQWTDGVISSTALNVFNEPSNVWSWVVCDGDVDPEWIESLNSVLDDNRLLTLPSGWRVQFGANVNFLFETHDLQYASPATISRLGIVLLSEEECCVEEAIEKWSYTAENEDTCVPLILVQSLLSAVSWSVDSRSEFLHPLHTMALIRQVLSQYKALEQKSKEEISDIVTTEDMAAMALMRGIGTMLKPKTYQIFLQKVSDWLGVSQHMLEFKPLDTCVTRVSNSDLCISPRIAAAIEMIRPWVETGSHFMILGSNACGKNILVDHLLRELYDKSVITIQCTPALNPAQIVQTLKLNMAIHLSSGNIGKMSNNGSLVLLVTSLHRAHVDSWGTSAVQSFLLQIIQHGGFWDSAPSHLSDGSGMHWYKLRRMQVVMTARFAAQTKLCTRLTNAVHTVLLREPEDEELPQICGLHLEKSLSAIDKKLQYDVRNASQSMFSLYTEVVETFVSQPHYKWTTSDLTNWCGNLLKYKIMDAQSVSQAIREESNFIFRDRLVVDKDKQLFDSLAQKYFTTQRGSCYIPTAGSHGVQLETSNENDWNKLLQKAINQCISEGDNKIFGDYEPECCLEISTLCTAAARSTCGSVLVALGSAGLGRRGAAQLAAAILQAKLISVTARHDLRTHIKNAIVTSGLEEQKVIMVISEEVSSHHSVLAIVESGTHHLLEQLDLNNTHTNQSKQLTHDEIATNVKENLGIVLLLDKDQSNLSDLLERYPMLYQKCHMLWTDSWDARTLRQMPQFVIQRLRQEIFLHNSDGYENNEVIPIDAFVRIHSSMNAVHLSAPCRYVSFIKAYFHIQRQKKVELNKRQTTLKAGVAALQKAQTEVNTLKSDAGSQEKALSEKQAKASHALNQISATVQSATAQREEMQLLKQNIQTENEKLQQRKKAIDEELATVEPVIAAARQAVGDIRPESLSEIRSLRAPPEVVRDVLEGVLRLMGVGDTSWHSMKTFLSKRGVKEDIRLFDASHTSPESLASVERLVSVRSSSFTEAASRRASAACAPLATWVKANLAYGRARAKVQPLEMEQRNLQQNLEQAESQLEALSSDLQTVDERVSSLKDQLNRYTKEGLEIEFKLNNAKATIAKTEELVDKLSSEFESWEENLKELSTGCTEITMRSVLAAACVVYLSDKTDEECSSAISSWCAELSYNPGSYSVPYFLSNPEQQLQWSADGLSNDATALKNAVVIHQFLAPVKCGLTPLIIDPDGDAGRWLRKTLSGNSCEFVSAHHERFHTSLQHAVRFGKVLVIEDVSSVEEWWSPLLFGQTASHDKFRLLLWSRDASLSVRIAPHQRALLAVLHFAPQLQGLADQLILFALEHDQPEIKEKLKSLKVEKASLQRQQYQLQENLLGQLSNSAGVDILHDSSLLSSLTQTRSSTSAIEASLTSAATLEAEVTSKTSAYRPSALRAAALLLSVRDLAATKFPLISMRVETLLELYVKALDDTRVVTKSDTLDSDTVVKNLLSSVLDRVTLALHKQHRCTVTLHVLRHVFPQDIPDEYWNVFTGNVTSYSKVLNETETLLPTWITGDCVKKCTYIKNCLPDFYDSLRLSDTIMWKAFMKNSDLQSIPGQLSAFQKVIVVQALRPEKVYLAVNNVIQQLLGRALAGTGAGARGAADPLGAALRWRRGSGKARPVLVVGARGTDPTQQLIANAPASDKLIQVWVNEKESETMSGLKNAVSRAAHSGAWVVLVVGAAPWFTALQTFIVNGTEHLDQDPESGFCLWIVSEDRDVPALVANTCISIVLEAPEGIRNNMMRTLSLWGDYSAPEPRTARLMFSLALLHSVVQERRAYIPQGWNLWYEFEWCDIQAGYDIISSRVDPQTAMGLVGALYGGRVQSAGDARVLQTLMRVLTGDAVAGHGWKPPGTNVHLPTDNRIQAYLEAIYSFPGTDSPAQLGLALNARAALDTRVADQLVFSVNQLQHLTETQDKENVISVKRSTAPILSLWKKLNSGPNSIIKGHSPTHKLQKKKSVGTHGWWEEVWERELSLAEAACRAVHVTLSAVAKGDRALATTIIKDEIPSEWQRLWAGPEAVIPYITELSHRATEAMKRNKYVNDPVNIIDIDLRSLLSPACVWGALLGATAELLQTGPESLRLRAHWGHSAKPPTGVPAVLVRGVCLEGAHWCEEAACVSPPASPSCPARALAPPILLYYTAYTQGSTNISRDAEIPLYSNSQRSTLLLWLDVPLKGYSDHAWTLNAAALYIAEN